MEEVFGSLINNGISNVLHTHRGEFELAEANWTKTGKPINYDYTFKGHLIRQARRHSARHHDNPRLEGLSDIKVSQATAEYRFFEAWFLCLSGTAEFNAVVNQAFKKFQDLAKTHKSGIFSHDELAQCFAGVEDYTKVTQFVTSLLTKAVVLTDPGRQSVPFESVADLLTLALEVVNVRMERYDSAKKGNREDERHHFQAIVAYLGILLQAITRPDKSTLHENIAKIQILQELNKLCAELSE